MYLFLQKKKKYENLLVVFKCHEEIFFFNLASSLSIIYIAILDMHIHCHYFFQLQLFKHSL